jgi:hypothetical protein
MENFKAVVSTISALVAMLSALWAYRSRIQTRADIFESQRDALILTLAENDVRCSTLELQCGLAIDELERVLPTLHDDILIEEATRLRESLSDIVKRTQLGGIRQYTEKGIDALKYSEKNLATLRRMVRTELGISKRLQPAGFDVVLKHVQHFIQCNDSKA